MSNTKYPDHHHSVVYKKPNHHRYNLNQRNDSDDEIDVFEATKYFAAGASNIHQKSMLNNNNIRNQDDQPVGRRSRISLDSSPFRNNQSFSSSQSHGRQKQTKDQKAYFNKIKQPVSPGGKLVSFLNSLFNQTSSSKKKKPTTSSNIKDEDQESHHGLGYGRRKRRSSISHFPSFNNNSNKITTSTAASISDMKSSPLLLYSSSLTSGFRTPPPFSTKTKMYQNSSSDLVTTSDQEFMFPNNLSKHSGRGSAISLQDQKMINRDMETLDVLYEKYKKINSLSEKQQNKDRDMNMVMRMTRRKVNDNQHDLDIYDDGGGESDSSSDLFELQNYDLCSEYCSVSGVTSL
ncbi:hypothetical protein MKX01_020614 [Papaver californicum]|nr:hypothetical protein MKX01_020614 [Papaver californicum]